MKKLCEIIRNIIKANKKIITFFAYQQDKVFRKFKENKKVLLNNLK